MKVRLLALSLLLLALSAGWDLLVKGFEGGEMAWLKLPGFFALLGLVGCIGLILISKLLGHLWLQRPEDYYEREERDG